MTMQRVLVVLVLVVLAYSGANGLYCYECNSHNDSRCLDDLPPDTMLQNCEKLTDGSKYTLCRKISQEVEFNVNGMPPDKRIIRGCGWDESKYKGKCYERGGLGGRQIVCSCIGDSCNSASGVKSHAFFHVGIPVSLFGIIRKFGIVL